MQVVEDVFQRADEIAAKHHQRGWFRNAPVETAARIRLRTAIYNAVMEERERCARIAEGQMGNTLALLTDPIQSSAAFNISQGIRGAS